jgi:hypothetical protein
MTARVGMIATVAALGLALCAAAGSAPAAARWAASRLAAPAGWFRAGSNSGAYEMVVDAAAAHDGHASARIRRPGADTAGFGTLMQTVAADRFRGHRVRFAADVRAQDVVGSAAIWMRADAACGRVVAFQNTEATGARGTLDWRRHAITFDVPPSAVALSFGALLSGSGTAWVSGLRLEVVGDSVPVTAAPFAEELPCEPGLANAGALPPAPVNLDFAGPALLSAP